MTQFVHVEQPLSHPGVERAEVAYSRLRATVRSFDGARGLAVLLLAAVGSSLLVVADRLMTNWNDGGLLMAWLVLWLVAFAGMALFAQPAHRLALRVVAASRRAAARRAAARADAQFLAHARHDPRILADLQAGASRAEAAQELSGIVSADVQRAYSYLRYY